MCFVKHSKTQWKREKTIKMNILEKKEKSNFFQKYTFSDSKSEAIEYEILLFWLFFIQICYENSIYKDLWQLKNPKGGKNL